MASVPDGNSPPRQDHLSKTRRQSALLDSPSRVTRSQVRRLSSAPVEVTMSPKPSTRRRSTIAPGSKNDTTNQDQVSPVQESEESVKSLPKRRSVRTSFSEPIEEVPPSSRSSKLTSIDEDLKSISAVESRPMTRRTRASMASLKTPVEPEPELSLPTTTRRTRRSSISSVSSITSSVVASPKRQTRSRKNLSPVPSPTASEVSTVSEVPETSPASKVSPVQVRSPLTKTTEKLLGTPRQLDFGDTNRPKTRSSFVVSDDQSEIVVSSAETGEGSQPGRRSHGRLSLKSPLKFVETDMEDTTKSNTEVVKPSNDNEDNLEPDFNKSRISVDRLSLSSKKSSCLSPSSQKASPAKDVNSDIILFGNESKTNSASRSPIIMLTKLRDEREDSETEGQTKRSSLRKSPPFKFDVSDKESQLETSNPKTSEENVSNIHNNSRRSSIQKIFLENSLSDKVPSDKVSNEDSSLTDSTEQQVFEVEDSSDTISVDVGVDKSNCRRFSLTSNKTTVDKHESTDGSPKLEAKGRFSLSSNKSTPAKSPKFDDLKVSNTDGQKSPLDRFSLSSKKTTPAKSLNSEGLHQGDTATPLSGSAKSSSKVSPANALNSTQLENDDPPNTFLSRFSLSFNNSTPAKVSPAKGESTPQLQLNESRGSLSARLSLSSNKSAQGTADESKHFVDNEESDQDSSSDSSERHEPIEDLNLSSKVGESSPRKSMGRQSLTPNKSLNASRGSSSGRLSLSSNKSAQATADKSEHNLDNEESDADTSSDSSEHNEPPEYLDSPVKTGESSPRKSMGRPSLTPRNESHSTSSARLSLSSNNSAQASADKSEHFVDNEESDDGSSSDSAEHHEPIEDLNLSSKVGESSPRKSMGRPSLTPNKSLNESRGSSSGRLSLSSNKSAHGTADKPEHNLDDEESDTDSSLDSSELNEPAEHLNLSVKTGESSPRKSIGSQSPCKSLNKSQDQEENAIIGTSDKAFKFFPQLNHNDLSRRASTGNVSSKPLKSNSKTRASMGTLINPFVSYVNFSEDKDASSDSSSENGHNSQNISDEHEFGGGDVTLSPIKKDNPIKKRSPTPVSEKSCSVTECQNSPSNLFDKSTVFNEESFESNSETSEQALESSVSSLQSKKLNTSGNNGNISIADDLPKEVTELNSSKKSSKSPAKDISKEGNNLLRSVSSDIGKRLGSTNVYKAAAALMKGGNFSDFDDNDSDDSQLQPVFSSTATSRMEKKLLQKQKKAQRRAEKEARKKLQKEQQLNQEPDSSKRSKKRRQKALSQSENDTPLIENANVSPSPSKNEENPIEENIQNAKKIKKQRSGSVGFGLAGTTDHENYEAINILSVASNGSDETECKTKKKKKKAIDGAASETKSTVDNADLKKKKKQKKVSEDASPVEEISLKNKKKPKSLLEDGLSVEELPKKKKRKLKEVLEDGSAVDELPKKKKKKLKLKEVSDDRSPQEELFVKKKKKLGVTSENQPLQVAVTTNSLKAVRKKDKHLVLQPSTASEENFSVSNSLQEKKKSKKDKFPVVGGSMEMSKKSSKKGTSDADEINTTELRNEKTLKKKSKKLVKKKSIPDQMEDTSEKQHEKKKKKKLKEKNVPVVAADVSDDDAPTSVSFAAGKNAAMELMEAAAEGVQNQIRLKQEQEKKRRDRMLHEKSAKMEKLKKKSHNFGAESSSSVKVSLLAPSSSKIYFDDKGNSLKNKAPKRLPADILDSLSEQPPTKFVKRSDGSKETAATLSGKQQDKMEKKKAKKLALKMEKKKVLESEYIPLDGVLGATRFGVVPLRNVMLAKKLEKNKLAEEAANFRQQNLFGNRIRRTPISTTISYQEKLKASLKGK